MYVQHGVLTTLTALIYMLLAGIHISDCTLEELHVKLGDVQELGLELHTLKGVDIFTGD